MEYLKKPLTKQQVIELTDGGDNYLKAIIPVTIYELLKWDMEDFVDMISLRAIDSTSLMDVCFNVVGISEDDSKYILIEISGDTLEFLERK